MREESSGHIVGSGQEIQLQFYQLVGCEGRGRRVRLGIFHREIHRPAESLIEHKLTRIEVKNGMKRKLTAIVLRYEVENLWVRAGGHCLSG